MGTGIVVNELTNMYVLVQNSLNDQLYTDNVLPTNVLFFQGAVDERLQFMAVNALYRCTQTMKNCPDAEDICHSSWPSCSPDMNSIKHVFYAMGNLCPIVSSHKQRASHFNTEMFYKFK
ncbi:hypothetical protein TNCT_536741 [Trichonephila clavata]|uniref:Uncharacterized protein n=1 Tax=Trichonephila clavata TaxID=2740835 RepID=A0A8X6G0T0_TRICU|nr:hypothetical protein TNCT_536741 [Trichonephila clavata]